VKILEIIIGVERLIVGIDLYTLGYNSALNEAANRIKRMRR
jgi:hypothetical protein